ncbi:hypothetical protein M8C21_001679 [Ambrosia artemisiifolia]|uniref:Uncharacterized protein n=1 Tax=Ambrosia artemisiifolia TaxID=4212 RepID=A0AAD5BM46_AMBAR|nr:hypothetical protein M8C21_001679 [Ambrosia artemisiifolia]
MAKKLELKSKYKEPLHLEDIYFVNKIVKRTQEGFVQAKDRLKQEKRRQNREHLTINRLGSGLNVFFGSNVTWAEQDPSYLVTLLIRHIQEVCMSSLFSGCAYNKISSLHSAFGQNKCWIQILLAEFRSWKC